jgi:cyclophilin family peptidyl-prolyl cis-trans isomerase
MRLLASKIRKLLGARPARASAARSTRRLAIERLEDRTVPSTTSAILSGVAYVDSNGNGVHDSNELVLPGASITLTGTTITNAPVNVTTQTAADGSFSFQNIQMGSYHLGGAAISSLQGGTPMSGTIDFSVTNGGVFTQDLGFGAMNARGISLRQFLSNSSISSFPFVQPAGVGTVPVSFRSNDAPFVKTAIPNIQAHSTGDTISLAGFFSDPDIRDTFVTFDTSMGPIKVELFDTQAPQTVANFLSYVANNTYANSIFHRLANLSSASTTATPQILQGGGFTDQVTGSPATLGTVPVLGILQVTGQTAHVLGPNEKGTIVTGPGLPNEFGAANAIGTLAMAKNTDPNSATNEFYFNLVDNSTALGATNNDGFTVFGKVVDTTDQLVLNDLAGVPTFNKGGAFTNIPLLNYTGTNFPSDTTPSNFDLINGVSVTQRNEELTYTVVGNTNPNLVNASVSNSFLNLTYAQGQAGTATITVQATDEFGATVQTSFNVTVATPSVSVALDSNAPTVATTALKATATPGGATGDNVSLNYQWKVNGNVVQSHNQTVAVGSTGNDTLNVSSVPGIHKGDTITLTVTPSIGTLIGTPSVTTVTVADAPPVLSGTVGITPSTPGVNDILTAVASATDPDGDPVTLSYQWSRNSTVIAGQTSSTLDLSSVSGITAGDKITLQVTPNDGTLNGAPGTATVTVT